MGPHSCPYEVNFHCHTLCSDGSLSPSELISQASKRKIKNIAVTDHNTINAYPEMYQWLKLNESSLNTIPNLWTGIEINAILKKTLVHIVGLGFDLYHKSLKPYIQGESTYGQELQAIKVVQAIHQAGGLAILAHPARYRLPYKELIDEAAIIGFDGAEAWYDYDQGLTWKPTKLVCNSIDVLLKEYNLLSSCGTDSHGKDLTIR